MAKLVRFVAKASSRDDEPGELGPPPDDAIAGAAWLNRVLRRELWSVINDPTLSVKERRGEILRYSRAITASTPNHEIYEAREVVRGDERDTVGPKLSGELTRATASRPRPLRSNAPRGK